MSEFTEQAARMTEFKDQVARAKQQLLAGTKPYVVHSHPGDQLMPIVTMRLDQQLYPIGAVMHAYDEILVEREAICDALSDVLDWAGKMPGFHQNGAVRAAQELLEGESP